MPCLYPKIDASISDDVTTTHMGPGDVYGAWMVSNTSSRGSESMVSDNGKHRKEGCDNEPVRKESKGEGAPKMEVFCKAYDCIYSTFGCLPLLKLLCHVLREKDYIRVPFPFSLYNIVAF